MKPLKQFSQKLRHLPWTLMAFMLLLPASATAAEQGINPWENILSKIVDSLTGPVAYSLAVIAIVISGVTMAFADLQGGARHFVQAVCGISIIFFAVSIVTQFLGFSGAVI